MLISILVIVVDLEPLLTDEEIGSGFPSVITFKAYESGDDPVVYLVSWGDGTRNRGVAKGNVRVQHAYDIPGTYSPLVQLVSKDDSVSFPLSVTVLPKRDREKPLHRWSGPALNLRELGSYVSSVEDSLSPILINPAKPAKSGSTRLLIPAGIVVEPRSSVQIVEGNKLVSGGSVVGSELLDEGTLLTFDFSLNDDYTEEAQVQIVGKATGYGGRNERAVNPNHGLKGAYDDELVKDSIGFLLATTPGERVMRPTFGTRLRELVFDMADEATAYIGQAYVLDAISEFESRATLINPEVTVEEDVLQLRSSIVFASGDSQVFYQSISLNSDTE